MEKERNVRDLIEIALKKIKYRLYQAEIGFASHDKERLKDMALRIKINAMKIIQELSDKNVKTRKLRKTKLVSRKRRAK